MQPTLRPGIGNTKHVFTPGGRKKPGSRIKRSWRGQGGQGGHQRKAVSRGNLWGT